MHARLTVCSYLPAAASWAYSSEGRTLLDDWMEANLDRVQAVQEAALHLRVPLRVLPLS